MKTFLFGLIITGLLGSLTSDPALAATGSGPEKDIIRAHQMKMKMTQLKMAAEKSGATASRAEVAVTAASGGISGTISGLTPEDIPGAWVMAWSKGDDVVNGDSLGSFGFSTVQPDGTYLISGLQTGLFTVYAYASNYVPQYYGSSSDSSGQANVPVTDGAITSGIDFELVRLDLGTGTLSGRVTNQANGDPIAWAVVFAFDYSDPAGYKYGWASTDQNGLYEISYLVPGNYTVSVWANGFLYTYYPGVTDPNDAVTVPVLANTTVNDLDIAMKEGAKIKGTIKDQLGKPIPYAYVEGYMKREGDPTDSSGVNFYSATMADENGQYVLSGIDAGDWIVYASAYWWPYYYYSMFYNQALTMEEATPVPVAENQVVSGIDFTFTVNFPTASVSGRLLNKNGDPISSTMVILQPNTITFGEDSTISARPYDHYGVPYYSYTDSNGYFFFDRILSDDYLIRTQSSYHWYQQTFWYPGVTERELATVLSVKDGDAVTGLEFVVDLADFSGSVSGKVTTASGLPLANAYIWLMSSWLHTDTDVLKDSMTYNPVWASAMTDAEGNYEVSPLPAGTYLIQAAWYGDNSQDVRWYENAETVTEATPVTLSAGENKTGINIGLNPKPIFGSLDGVVKWADGTVVAGAYIEIAPYWDSSNLADWYWGNWNQFTTTDESGAFRFDQLREGQYTVTVYANGDHVYYPNGLTLGMAEPVTIIAGETLTINPQLTKSDKGEGAISGVVSLEDGISEKSPAFVVIAKPTVTVMVWPQSEFFYTAVTNPDGSYELSNMADGEYLVYAFGSGTIGEFYDGVYTGSQATPVEVKNQQITGSVNFKLSYGYWLDSPIDSLENIRGGRIFGKVKNKHSELMTEAIVNLVDQEGKVMMSVKTNAKGHYELTGVPGGTYSVRAEKTGMGESAGSEELVTVRNNSIEKDLIIALTNSPVDVDEKDALPEGITLMSVYPNPFNPETSISFRLSKPGLVSALVFNVLGQQVRDLSVTVPSAGESVLRWDGRDSNGSQVSSGLYIIRLSAGNQVVSSKLILSR
ncbi:MAG: carboxypeptidase regulatory-like domain-containing protein [Bacteroidetes bacterium]|nr:carboxypeptidase regulatory-like domain-containing protein [Bacteroidota bacterium]